LQFVPHAHFPAEQVQQVQAPSQTDTAAFRMVVSVAVWFVFFILIIPLFYKKYCRFFPTKPV